LTRFFKNDINQITIKKTKFQGGFMQLFTTQVDAKERKGLVKGVAIYSEKYGDSIKTAIEVKKGGYVEKFEESTNKVIEEATDRMTTKANDLGANAIEGIRINVRNITSNSSDFITIVSIYGTAITI